jgi:ABC-type transport system involved in cytochrome c biogenesis ATPase subunit
METQPQATQTETKPSRPRIRVSKVTLEGFKAFREPFTFEIPPPLALDDPDVIVIGSSNGLGKTSLLEGICLGMLAQHDFRPAIREQAGALLINAGAHTARLHLIAEVDGEECHLDAHLFPNTVNSGAIPAAWHERVPFLPAYDVVPAVEAMVGNDDNPVVAPPVLYFHSYRKVIPLPLELADIMEPRRPRRAQRLSVFKFRVLKTLLAQADLLEGADTPEAATDVLGRLDDFLVQFAGAERRKLQSGPDDANALDLQVAQGREAPSMPFDALSSGQKEIISTLFLIWEATRDCPSVVLIDEPELHLHQEWHDDIMRMLFELAPQNQYIIATHSSRIARSVYPDRLRTIQP